MWKFLRRIVLIAILMIVSVIGWVTFSPAGTHWAIRQANQSVEALKIEGIQGRLYDGLEIKHLEFDDGTTKVELRQFLSSWNLSCLLRQKLCLENITADELLVQLPPADTTTSAPPSNAPFQIPALPLEIELKNARISTLSWTQESNTQSLQNIFLSLSADQNAIDIRSISLDWQDNTLSLKANIKLEEHYPLSASVELQAPELFGPKHSQFNLDAKGLLDGKLHLIATLAGHQQAEIKAFVFPLQDPIQLDGELTASLLQSLEPKNPVAQLQDVSLQFSGNLKNLNLDLKALLSGSDIPTSKLDLSTVMLNTAELQSLQLQVETLQGLAKLQGSVAWAPHLRWQLDGEFKDLNLAEIEPQADAIISGNLLSSGEQVGDNFVSPTTHLDLNGELQGLPLNAEIDASLAESGAIELSKVILQSGDNQLEAQGSIDKNIDIQGDLSAAKLASLWPGLDGTLQGTFRASGLRSSPDIQADLKAKNLKFADTQASLIELNAQIANGGQNESLLTLSVEDVHTSSTNIESLRADLDGSLSNHRLSLKAKTPQQFADLLAQGALQSSNWAGTLQRAKLNHQAYDLVLQRPTDIAWNNNTAQITVDAHCWKHSGASACLEERAILGALDGDVKLAVRDLSLDSFNSFLPKNTHVAGKLKAEIESSWVSGSQPVANVQSNITGLSLNTLDPAGENIALNFQQAQLNATLNETLGVINLVLASKQQGKTQINAQIDPNTQSLKGDIALKGFLLEPLKPLIPLLDTLKGQIDASGVLSGTLIDPKFNGQLTLNDPALAGTDIPLAIEGGQLQLDIQGRQAKLSSDLEISPSGNLQLNGDIAYNNALTANIKLIGDKLAISLPPTVEATVNHELAIQYKSDQVSISGDIHIPDANIVLEGMAGSGPALSKDLVYVDADNQPEQATEEAPPMAADVDIRVQVDDAVQLSGYGFNTQLHGNIKVRQRIDQPVQLAGELLLKNGLYQAYGQDLEVRRGELHFVGPVRATRIDVNAVRIVDDVQAGLKLEGELVAPKATLYSEPAMPDADVLSYILLGAPPGQGGGDESAMLARAALGLGLKNGNRIAGQFASAAGIQDFNIGADGKGDDTAVVLSGKLSPKLMLSYRMGIFDTVNTLTARYDLSKALYLEFVKGANQAIDLFYTVDY